MMNTYDILVEPDRPCRRSLHRWQSEPSDAAGDLSQAMTLKL